MNDFGLLSDEIRQCAIALMESGAYACSDLHRWADGAKGLECRVAELEHENKTLRTIIASRPDVKTSSGAISAIANYEIYLREKRIAELERENESLRAEYLQEKRIAELERENESLRAEMVARKSK